MAQQTIGIGSSANDGTGDPLRTAFTKIYTNFTELYGDTAEANDLLEDSSPQLGGNLDINGFNITSARSNEDIVLVPSGTGGVIASGIRLVGTTISADDSSTININEGLNVDGAATIEGATTLAAMTATTGSYSSTLGVSGVTTLTTTNIDNLTIQDANISSASNSDINIIPGGTGDVVLSALRVNGTTLNSSDSTKVTIAEALDVTGATALAALSATSGTFSTTLGVSGVTTLTTTNIDNLTIQDANISSSSNSDINITPGGTGNVIVHGLTINGTSIASADSTTVNINDILNVDGATTIEGTLTTAAITATGVVTVTGQADIDWIRIKDNVITTNATNAILNLGANSSGTVNVMNAMTTVAQTVTGNVAITGKLDVDNIEINGNTITATSSNGGISITPNGTGLITLNGDIVTITKKLVVESITMQDDLFMQPGAKIVSVATNSDILLETNGTGSIMLNTLGFLDNAITPIVTNADIQLKANGTGKIDAQVPIMMSQFDTLTNSSVSVDLTTPLTKIDSSGGTIAITMAAGETGQIKVLTMTVAGNAATMTAGNGNLPASVSTSVVWDAVGETCSFIYSGAKWVVIGNQGATIS